MTDTEVLDDEEMICILCDFRVWWEEITRGGRTTGMWWHDNTNGDPLYDPHPPVVMSRGEHKKRTLHRLLDVMVERREVRVIVDLENGIGEVTTPKGWVTIIKEIRRPAKDVLAYGHLGPVICVSVPDSPGMTLMLRMDQLEVVE